MDTEHPGVCESWGRGPPDDPLAPGCTHYKYSLPTMFGSSDIPKVIKPVSVSAYRLTNYTFVVGGFIVCVKPSLHPTIAAPSPLRQNGSRLPLHTTVEKDLNLNNALRFVK